MVTVMYGPAIQEAIASGNLVQMRRLRAAAERKLREEGNVASALETLKIEIAKIEAATRSKAGLRKRKR